MNYPDDHEFDQALAEHRYPEVKLPGVVFRRVKESDLPRHDTFVREAWETANQRRVGKGCQAAVRASRETWIVIEDYVKQLVEIETLMLGQHNSDTDHALLHGCRVALERIKEVTDGES